MKIAILTAVTTEYETIRNLFAAKKTGEIREIYQGAFFYESIPIVIDNTSIDIIVGMSDQGNVEASITVNDVLSRFNPDLFFFAGTCGGIKDVSVGDSIIVTKVFDLMRGKDSDIWHAKPTLSGMDARNIGICRSLMMAINRGDILHDYYSDCNNKIHMGAIGSSSTIVASENSNIRKIIKDQYANIIAVEMEGYGFYQTLETNEYRAGIMIRAVTDDAKNKTPEMDNKTQPYGMQKVYHLIYQFIEKYVSNTELTISSKMSKKNSELNTLISKYESTSYFKLPEKPVFAGFLSFDWQLRANNLFHLGHAYFVKFVDALLDLNQKVVIYICSSNNNFHDMNQEKYLAYCEILDELTNKWKKCFNERVEVIDVGETLRTIQYGKDSWEKRAEDYLRLIEGKFFKFFNKKNHYTTMLSSLTNWRINGTYDEELTRTLEDALEIHPSDVKGDNGITTDEIYAISYILLKKPRWYSSEWMIRFINFFGETMHRADSFKDIVIIESQRNAYSWLGMSYLAKKMNRLFPPMVFFKTVPDISTQKYMNTDTPELCITLDNYQDISALNIDHSFIEKMSHILAVDESEVFKQIYNLMDDCNDRMR